VPDDDGNTPLHIATRKRNIHAVALLLAFGADM
jgi:ankyrin repeat protein